MRKHEITIRSTLKKIGQFSAWGSQKVNFDETFFSMQAEKLLRQAYEKNKMNLLCFPKYYPKLCHLEHIELWILVNQERYRSLNYTTKLCRSNSTPFLSITLQTMVTTKYYYKLWFLALQSW